MSIKKNSIIDFPTDYTSIDIETTGFSPRFDSIIEIGAIRYRNDEPVAEFSTFVDSDVDIPNNIQILTGIQNDDLKGSPKIDTAMNEFLDFIGDDILLGHNIGFDIAFLQSNTDKPINNKCMVANYCITHFIIIYHNLTTLFFFMLWGIQLFIIVCNSLLYSNIFLLPWTRCGQRPRKTKKHTLKLTS